MPKLSGQQIDVSLTLPHFPFLPLSPFPFPHPSFSLSTFNQYVKIRKRNRQNGDFYILFLSFKKFWSERNTDLFHFNLHIHWLLLSVHWLGFEPTTVAYVVNALTNWAAQPELYMLFKMIHLASLWHFLVSKLSFDFRAATCERHEHPDPSNLTFHEALWVPMLCLPKVKIISGRNCSHIK